MKRKETYAAIRLAGKVLSRHEQRYCKGGLGDEGVYLLVCYHPAAGYFEATTLVCYDIFGPEAQNAFCDNYIGLNGSTATVAVCYGGGDSFW